MLASYPASLCRHDKATEVCRQLRSTQLVSKLETLLARPVSACRVAGLACPALQTRDL